MADRRGDARTAAEINGGRNRRQNRARPAAARHHAVAANEVRRPALTHKHDGQETVMEDEREGIAVDFVRWAFRVLRHLEQRSSG